ncbi:MAG: prepilin peptidase [Candidatus Wallbacteria bacterium]|nr:prepilin peptidase [Candidatus Wallbacteria bacterium]
MSGTEIALNYFGMTIYICAILICIWSDLKYRRIYNWVTFPAMFCGMIWRLIAGGIPSLKDGMLGLGLGFCLLVLPFLLHGVGAGDLKLLMACGAFSGVQGVIFIFLVGSALGFFGSLYTIMRHGGFANLHQKLQSIANKEFLAKKAEKLEKSEGIPYGVFYGLAGIAQLFWGKL